MRTRLVSILSIPAIDRRISVLASALSVALLTSCASAAPAFAWSSSHGPQYTLAIVEGETTLPEYQQVAVTSGKVEGVGSNQQVAVSIVRNGTTVYRDVENDSSAWLSQVPQPGETVTLESPVGTLIGSVQYDGLPSISASVCAGSTNFSGENSSGDTVEGSYVTYSPQTDPYGHVSVQSSNYGQAQVKTLSGTAFGGSFLAPLALGETVAATESLKTPLAGGGTYTYVSELQRPVGACPVPPPPFDPPSLPIVLQGSLLKLPHVTTLMLLKSSWRDQVSINQAGTVTQDLYLAGGKLPAFAARAGKHHHKMPSATLLARGTAMATGAGTVSVLLKPTADGRRKLKSAKSVDAILVTTLRTSAGQTFDLARHSLTLRR
jgi:hypothetical protein